MNINQAKYILAILNDGGLRLQLFRRGKQAFPFPIRIEPNRARRRTEHRRQGV